VGLHNVRRRLEICYGAAAALRLTPDPAKTSAEIVVPLAAARPADARGVAPLHCHPGPGTAGTPPDTLD
jgi:hypothetical protein